MRIIQYEVEKLYNSFNHQITFNENITIILGQNGLGKTAMLAMLYGLFSHDFHLLLKYPYDSIILTFDNKKRLIIKKIKIKMNKILILLMGIKALNFLKYYKMLSQQKDILGNIFRLMY